MPLLPVTPEGVLPHVRYHDESHFRCALEKGLAMSPRLAAASPSELGSLCVLTVSCPTARDGRGQEVLPVFSAMTRRSARPPGPSLPSYSESRGGILAENRGCIRLDGESRDRRCGVRRSDEVPSKQRQRL